MSTVFTLIARKDTSEEYCCGQVYERYWSDFQIEIEDSHEAIARRWAYYEAYNLTNLGKGEAGYECTLLIDGRNIDAMYDRPQTEIDEFDQIKDLMRAYLEDATGEWKRQQELKKQREAADKAERARLAAVKKEADELAEFKRLQAKFGAK